MREIPTLLSTPMVQATLDGRKSQTRRVKGLDYINESPDQWEFVNTSDKLDFPRPADCRHPEDPWYLWNDIHNNGKSFISQCPYGKPGDILWVRETFYAYGIWIKNGKTKSGKQAWTFCDTTSSGFKYHYEDKPPESVLPNTTREQYGWFKRPSIFMPREACRILLEVTDVRVERLQDISEEDAKAEGAPESLSIKELEVLQGMDWMIPSPFLMHQFGFLAIWCKINGQKSWLNNPFVWVISFRRIQS